jgi:hypothetical protein
LALALGLSETEWVAIGTAAAAVCAAIAVVIAERRA